MTAEAPSLPASAAETGARPRFEFSKLVRAAGFVAVFLALTSASTTFLILLGLTPIDPTQSVVYSVMAVNGALVLFLIFVVGWELGTIYLARRRGRSAARLHIRIVALFGVVAV